MFRHLFISIIFGALLGASTSLYGYGLEQIQLFQNHETIYPYFLILVFGLLYIIKRHTLFFPTTVSHVLESSDVEEKYWSKLSYVWNLFGSWISHAAGASLGREGTAIVLASSLAQAFQLNWRFYRPIVVSAAFAGVVGQPIIAVVFMRELFVTTIDQKLFALIMAWVGFLVMQSFHIMPLFILMDVDLSADFSDKLWFVIFLGVLVGSLARFFKYSYKNLNHFFSIHIKWSVLAVLIMTIIMILPQTKPLHSLSMNMLSDVFSGHADLHLTVLKMLVTILFLSLGFIGGDFVPVIILGSSFGILTAQIFQVPYSFGLAMGMLAFFTGVTRLKWTNLALLFLLAGFKVMLWAYVCLSVVRYFSGELSIYRQSKAVF